MWPMFVVRRLELIKPALQGPDVDWQQGKSEPDAQRSEQTFDLAVERWVADFAFHYSDAKKGLLELVLDLAALVGDDESRLAVRSEVRLNDVN